MLLSYWGSRGGSLWTQMLSGRESRGERFRHSLVRLNCSDKVAETPSPQEFSPHVSGQGLSLFGGLF